MPQIYHNIRILHHYIKKNAITLKKMADVQKEYEITIDVDKRVLLFDKLTIFGGDDRTGGSTPTR